MLLSLWLSNCIFSVSLVLTIFEVAHFVAGLRSPSEEDISLQYSGRKLLRWRLRALQLWKWVIYNCNPWLRCTIFFSSQRLSSPHFSHRIVKVLHFTVKRPVTFNLLPLKLFDSFNTFQWEIELIFILMFLLFEGRCTTQQAGGAIICLVPNDYIWDYPQDVRAFFQPGEEIMGALVPLLRYP